MVMHLFAKKGNYGEDIDYDLFRDIIKRLVRMVENSRIENKTIAIPRFNFGNFKKMENIMIVLSENTSVEFKVYHPWD
jgi:archaellum biogenesis ATPase FlaH